MTNETKKVFAVRVNSDSPSPSPSILLFLLLLFFWFILILLLLFIVTTICVLSFAITSVIIIVRSLRLRFEGTFILSGSLSVMSTSFLFHWRCLCCFCHSCESARFLLYRTFLLLISISWCRFVGHHMALPFTPLPISSLYYYDQNLSGSRTCRGVARQRKQVNSHCYSFLPPLLILIVSLCATNSESPGSVLCPQCLLSLYTTPALVCVFPCLWSSLFPVAHLHLYLILSIAFLVSSEVFSVIALFIFFHLFFSVVS